MLRDLFANTKSSVSEATIMPWKITALLLLSLAAVSWALYAQISHTSELRELLEQHQRELESPAHTSGFIRAESEARRCLISA